jgi:hypothetical protein
MVRLRRRFPARRPQILQGETDETSEDEIQPAKIHRNRITRFRTIQPDSHKNQRDARHVPCRRRSLESHVRRQSGMESDPAGTQGNAKKERPVTAADAPQIIHVAWVAAVPSEEVSSAKVSAPMSYLFLFLRVNDAL